MNNDPAAKLKLKYPERLPVLLDDSNLTKPLKNKKYLVPKTFFARDLVSIIRKKEIKLTAQQAIFLSLPDNYMFPGNKNMAEVYKSTFDNKGFIKITVLKENTFGE